MNRNYYNSLQGLNGENRCNWWCRNREIIARAARALGNFVPGAALVAEAIELIGDSFDNLRTITIPTTLLPSDEAKLKNLLERLEAWLESIKFRTAEAVNNQNIAEANAILKDLYLIQTYYTNPTENVLQLERQDAVNELNEMMYETRNVYENIILSGFEKNNTGVGTSNSYVIPLLVREQQNMTFTHKVILTSTDPNNTSIVAQIANGTAPKDALFTQEDVVMPGDPKNIPDKFNPATGEPIKKDGIPIWVWLLIGVGAYKLLKKK